MVSKMREKREAHTTVSSDIIKPDYIQLVCLLNGYGIDLIMFRIQLIDTALVVYFRLVSGWQRHFPP
jgi:hypothetical protein